MPTDRTEQNAAQTQLAFIVFGLVLMSCGYSYDTLGVFLSGFLVSAFSFVRPTRSSALAAALTLRMQLCRLI